MILATAALLSRGWRIGPQGAGDAPMRRIGMG
jgi:hypothetical protein